MVADFGNDAARLVDINDTAMFQVSMFVSVGLSGPADPSYIVSEDILLLSNSHYPLRVNS